MSWSRDAKIMVSAILISGATVGFALWHSGALSSPGIGVVSAAYQTQASGVMVESRGRVKGLLRDDRRSGRHQRFLLELESGLTVLVTHNLNLAPRVEDLARGDTIRLRGMYQWNERGGVIHFTHHDPENRRPGGWIEHEGNRYR